MKKLLMYAAGAAFGVGSLGATSAMADGPVQGAPDCADQLACIYINSWFQGKLEHKGAGAPLSNVAYDNITSSWVNKTYATGAWFMGFNGSSYCFTMAPRTPTPVLSSWQNDRLSSWRLTTGC